MDRRRFLAVSGIALSTTLAGCSGDDDPDESGTDGGTDDGMDSGSSDGQDGGQNDDNEDGGEETENVEEPEPQSFSGSGSEVRDDIVIEGGLTVVEATHTGGSSNFQIELVPSEGDFNELFANEIGEYDGVQAGLVDADTYQLDVTADGDWEITIRQPRAESGEAVPVSIDGDTYTVEGPYEFSGNHMASGSHEGDGNFIVEVFPPEGDFGEVVFNEIGEFEGETTFSADGVGWIAVQANGNWTLDIE